MTEIRLWKWQYTDDSGQTKTSRWLMTEREALRYRNAIRLQHTLRVVYDEKNFSQDRAASQHAA